MCHMVLLPPICLSKPRLWKVLSAFRPPVCPIPSPRSPIELAPRTCPVRVAEGRVVKRPRNPWWASAHLWPEQAPIRRHIGAAGSVFSAEPTSEPAGSGPPMRSTPHENIAVGALSEHVFGQFSVHRTTPQTHLSTKFADRHRTARSAI